MEKNKKEDCIFCKIVNKEVPATIVYEDDNFIGFLDADPEIDGHTLIVPKKHFKTLLDMPSSLGNEMLEAIKKVALDLINKGKAEGFNVVINNYKVAGQIVPHTHIHILPRKNNDGFNVKVINTLRDQKSEN